MFDLQKFAGAGDSHTTEEAGWYLTTAYTFWYCPAGFEYVTDEGIDLDAIFLNYATNPSGWVISGLNNPDSHDNITGDTITAVIDASYVSSVDNITVEGDNKTSLHVVIGSTTYGVDSNGKLYIPTAPLPDFGLMTKADKQKLDDIADTCVTSGESTANGFVLKNRLGAVVITIPNMS